MALKTKINAFDFQSLSEELQAEYKLQTDGTYALDLGGMFVTDLDPSGLKSALEKEREQNKGYKEKFDAIERERDEAKREAELAELGKGDSVEKLTALFKEQEEKLKQHYEAQVQEQRERVEKQQSAAAEQHRKTKAMEIATELFGKKAPLAVPHILENLKAVPGEEPKIEILNSAGEHDITASFESYKESFLTNPLFEDMLITTQASGGSASDRQKAVPANGRPGGQTKGFNDLSTGELADLRAKNPGEYDRLKTERDAQSTYSSPF